MENNKYYRLVQEIVCQACYDYAKALKKLASGKRYGVRYTDYQLIKEDCEYFFRSRWFGVLCDLDPDALMENIQKAVHNGEEIYPRNGIYVREDYQPHHKGGRKKAK